MQRFVKSFTWDSKTLRYIPESSISMFVLHVNEFNSILIQAIRHYLRDNREIMYSEMDFAIIVIILNWITFLFIQTTSSHPNIEQDGMHSVGPISKYMYYIYIYMFVFAKVIKLFIYMDKKWENECNFI